MKKSINKYSFLKIRYFYYILGSILALILIVVFFFSANIFSKPTPPTYSILKSWGNGEEQQILVAPNLTPQELEALGNALEHTLQDKKIAFILIYDDKNVLPIYDKKMNRTEVAQIETDFYDKHYIAHYRKSVSGYNRFIIHNQGLVGPNSVIKY